MSFSKKVNRLLKENKMTKAALAKESGIPYTTLDSMLKRETDTARLEAIFRMAKALGTSVEALVFDDEEEVPVSPEEKRILELYSLLDSRGKNTVLSLMEREADNSKEGRKALRTVPLYEAPAAAGVALPVLTEEAGELTYREGEIPAGTSFAIRISGDSMEPRFFDGDLVYVEKTKELRSGQIGIFILNGESLCKMYTVKDSETYLYSLNTCYEPIHVLESDRLELVGRVLL
ncbi:MAG: helix-turn-helix domain-containing protein [Clostridia bacterium]|nr:helix-turn-helix domain-containing protein [Clostridia bacterium]